MKYQIWFGAQWNHKIQEVQDWFCGLTGKIYSWPTGSLYICGALSLSALGIMYYFDIMCDKHDIFHHQESHPAAQKRFLLPIRTITPSNFITTKVTGQLKKVWSSTASGRSLCSQSSTSRQTLAPANISSQWKLNGKLWKFEGKLWKCKTGCCAFGNISNQNIAPSCYICIILTMSLLFKFVEFLSIDEVQKFPEMLNY